jgi:preprotein translocase subunit YajC
MKKGNRVKTNNGFFGTVLTVHWRGASCAGFCFIDRVDIVLDSGIIVTNLDPKSIEVIDG